MIKKHRRRKRGPGPPPIVLEEGGGNIPFAVSQPPIIQPHFPSTSMCEPVKARSQMYQFNICTFSLFEGISKSILFNSVLNFAILSVFNVRNVIIWH